MCTTTKVRAQSLRVGDKLRAKVLRGTVVKVEKGHECRGGRVQIYVVVEHANGTTSCKSFHPGYCVTILARETEKSLANV